MGPRVKTAVRGSDCGRPDPVVHSSALIAVALSTNKPANAPTATAAVTKAHLDPKEEAGITPPCAHLRLDDAGAEAVVPDQPPPGVLRQVKVAEGALRGQAAHRENRGPGGRLGHLFENRVQG